MRLVALLVVLCAVTACDRLPVVGGLPAERSPSGVVARPAGAVRTTPPVAPPRLTERAGVVRIVDGDTLVVRIGRRAVRVRLIGVDAPEIGGPADDCYGYAAYRALARLLPPGSPLELAGDREAYDPYRRSLFYAWTPRGVFVNAALIKDGYARAMVVPPNDRYAAHLHTAESIARQARTGRWTACS